MNPKIKAIIFDLDGVLIDAVSVHYDAFIRALKPHGFYIPPEEHDRYYNGLPTIRKLELMTEKVGLDPNLYDAIQASKQASTQTLLDERCIPCRDKLEMMATLKEEGFNLACCSNSIRATLDRTLTNTELMPYLDLTISCQEVNNPKPAPDIYLQAFQMLDVQASQTVIVEDSPIGIASADASGAHVCRVTGFEEVNYPMIRAFLSSI